jgi:signal transduction histidine kinase
MKNRLQYALDDVCVLLVHALPATGAWIYSITSFESIQGLGGYGEKPSESELAEILHQIESDSVDENGFQHVNARLGAQLLLNDEGDILAVACVLFQSDCSKPLDASVLECFVRQSREALQVYALLGVMGTLNERIKDLYQISSQADRGLDWQIQETLEVLCGFLATETGLLCSSSQENISVEYVKQGSPGFALGQALTRGGFLNLLEGAPDEILAFESQSPLIKQDPAFGSASSILGLRLQVRGEGRWSIIFLSQGAGERGFSDSDYEITRLGGHFIASLLEKLHVQQRVDEVVAELERTLENQNTLTSIFEITLSALELEQKLDRVIEIICSSWRDLKPLCGIFLYNRETETLQVQTARGFVNNDCIPAFEMSAELLEPRISKTNLRIPLRLGDNLLGLLSLELTSKQFSDFEIEFAQSLGHALTVLVHHDNGVIELREAMQRAEEATKIKGYFLASMSHELRTPMNSILGFTDRLRKRLKETVSERDLDCLDVVYRNAVYLLGLINDILDLSKLEADKVALSFSEFDLSSLISQTLISLSPLAESKSLHVQYSCEHSEVIIFADRIKVTQIVTNLLSNALRYTDRGGIRVVLETASLGSPPVPHAIFKVTDTGIGIAEEYREAIFDKFTQIDRAEDRRRGGTGLGLAITKEYVEMHHGSIQVESTLGVGSTFIVGLPLEVEQKL